MTTTSPSRTPPTSATSPTSSSAHDGANIPLRPAKQRTGAGPIGWVGPVLAVLVVLLGLVLLRDGIFTPATGTGWPGNQPSWTGTATSSLDGVGAATWMVPVGVVVALVGLYLLVVALRRRAHRAMPLAGPSGAYLLPNDVARRATSAAQDIDGVLDASSSATRRRVTVSVTATGGSSSDIADLRAQVTSAVQQSLSALASPPGVRVKTTTGDDSGKKDLA